MCATNRDSVRPSRITVICPLNSRGYGDKRYARGRFSDGCSDAPSSSTSLAALHLYRGRRLAVWSYAYPHPETRTFHRVRGIPSEPKRRRRRKQYTFIRTNRVTVYIYAAAVTTATMTTTTAVADICVPRGYIAERRVESGIGRKNTVKSERKIK
ncbi:hypothetical protein QTP88_000336 [Uroleucon formosanum]